MKYLLDNHLPLSMAATLSALRFRTSHVREFGLERADDDEIIEFAKERRFVIITADTDFPELLALSGSANPSIVYLTEGTPTKPEPLSILLANTLPLVRKDLAAGAVVAIGLKRVRVRRLPIGPPR